MSIRSFLSAVHSTPAPPVLTPEPASPGTTLMTCEICDLVGGPFQIAEAAHLRAIHDRLHHGISTAA